MLVLERNDYIGGAAVSRRLYDDFTYSNCSYVCSLLRTEIIRALELPRYGLQIIPYEGGCTMMRNGGHLALYDNHDALRREIARHSPRDAEAYDRYVRDMLRQCRFIKPLLLREPPDPTSFRPRDLRELLYLGRHFYRLGEARMYDTLRFWTMSCCRLARRVLRERDRQGAPRRQLHHRHGARARARRDRPTCCCITTWGASTATVGAWGFARGGMGAITQALAASLVASGGTVRTGAPVEQILVRDGRATGVVLEGGEEIHARIVVSNLDVQAHLPRRRWPPSTCRRNFSSRCGASRSAAPPASSTSRSTGCRTSRRFRKAHRARAATCT